VSHCLCFVFCLKRKQRFLRGLPKNVAVLMTSHHTHLIGENERVLLVENGRIIQEGVWLDFVCVCLFHAFCSGKVADVRRGAGILSGLFAEIEGSGKAKEEIVEEKAAQKSVVPQLRATVRQRGRVGLEVYVFLFETRLSY
jgi:ABC-type multidrug transport system ATPase subunit